MDVHLVEPLYFVSNYIQNHRLCYSRYANLTAR
jgi:hypothetical protein